MKVVIQIPSALRALTGNLYKVEVEAESVGEALTALIDRYPSLSRYIFDEQQRLRSFVNIFVNDTDIKTLNGLDTRLKDSDRLLILPAISGGRAL
ncbi:MAG: ubiquitin-like small modifier protein 1 [Nitrososphaerota archaeon]|nr:MoaD family protein [Candidatus Calditenuaceae archaeon]MDW8073111.1 ubiquitin-like small modifier protein 1 [Nitrososphaerota archaeon]